MAACSDVVDLRSVVAAANRADLRGRPRGHSLDWGWLGACQRGVCHHRTCQLSTIADPGGRTLTLGYTAGYVTSLSGPGGGVLATYSYDALGRLESVTYPDSAADPDTDPDDGYTFVYDGTSGRLWQVKDLLGRVLETHLYYANGKAQTSEISGGIEKYTFTYEPKRTLVTSRRSADQPQDDVTVYEWASYHGVKRVTRITGPCGACGGSGGGDVQEWSYDAKGRVASHTDGAGNVTTYEYDATTGDLLAEHRPLDHTTRYTYYPDRRVWTVTQPNGRVTTYTYVPAGVQSIRDTVEPRTLDRITSFTYTSRGQLETLTDPRSKVTAFTYEPVGDLRTLTDPLGTPTPDPDDHVTTFEYDALGRRTAAIDPLGQRTETDYDTLGRVAKVRRFHRDEQGVTHEFVTTVRRDQGGRRTQLIDALQRMTDYTYDDYGRLWYVDEPEPVVGQGRPRTTYGYDLMSNLASVTDAEQHTTTFVHDAYRRVELTTYPGPELREERYSYDSAGRLRTKTDRRGVITTFSYDAAHLQGLLGRHAGRHLHVRRERRSWLTDLGRPRQVRLALGLRLARPDAARAGVPRGRADFDGGLGVRPCRQPYERGAGRADLLAIHVRRRLAPGHADPRHGRIRFRLRRRAPADVVELSQRRDAHVRLRRPLAPGERRRSSGLHGHRVCRLHVRRRGQPAQQISARLRRVLRPRSARAARVGPP